MMKTSVVVSLVAFLCWCCLPAASVAYGGVDGTAAKSNGTCLYIISVQTGTVQGAGTDAVVSVTFRSADGKDELSIADLTSWPHDRDDTFENGNLDRFQGNARCMDLCQMHLGSDNSGEYPDWYVEFVRVEAVGDGSDPNWQETRHMFDVDQWLALDEPPHQLFADRNVCGTGGVATM